jgi:hypothetical protein
MEMKWEIDRRSGKLYLPLNDLPESITDLEDWDTTLDISNGKILCWFEHLTETWRKFRIQLPRTLPDGRRIDDIWDDITFDTKLKNGVLVLYLGEMDAAELVRALNEENWVFRVRKIGGREYLAARKWTDGEMKELVKEIGVSLDKRNRGRPRKVSADLMERRISRFKRWSFRVKRTQGHPVLTARKSVSGRQTERYMGIYDRETKEIVKKLRISVSE